MVTKITVKEGNLIQEEILNLIKRKQQLNEELAKLNRKLKEKLNLQRQVIIDYESWVKQKSIEKFGEVKASYSIREVSKITGISRSTIHHRIMEGQILTLGDKNKRIPFEEVVKLVSLYYWSRLINNQKLSICPTCPNIFHLSILSFLHD